MIHAAINLDALAEQLHRANAGVPEWCRHAFYGAKSFLLSAFGTPDGRDIQKIDYECFGCHGTGERRWYHAYSRMLRDVEPCYRCNATGVHHSRMTWLDRYRFGSHCFHVPVDGVTFYADAKPTIKGKIEHKPYADSARCAVDIAWLFNREALRRDVTFRVGCYGGFSQAADLDGPGANFCRSVASDKADEIRAERSRREAEPVGNDIPF